MNQKNIPVDKKHIYDEIDELRTGVGSNPRIKLRAQTDIFSMLDSAVEILDKGNTNLDIRRALSKVEIARKRIVQADSQHELLPWLPLSITLFLVAILGIIIWVIIRYSRIILPVDLVWLKMMIAAALAGSAGSAADGLRELRTRLARQELDLIRSIWYFTHPLIGAVSGSILFLIVYAGLFALTGTDTSNTNADYQPALIYALAAAGGFAQRQVIQYFRVTLASILHTGQEPPEEAG